MVMAAFLAAIPGGHWILKVLAAGGAYALTLALAGEFRPVMAGAARPIAAAPVEVRE
jgi:hypothetical protein